MYAVIHSTFGIIFLIFHFGWTDMICKQKEQERCVGFSIHIS